MNRNFFTWRKFRSFNIFFLHLSSWVRVQISPYMCIRVHATQMILTVFDSLQIRLVGVNNASTAYFGEKCPITSSKFKCLIISSAAVHWPLLKSPTLVDFVLWRFPRRQWWLCQRIEEDFVSIHLVNTEPCFSKW